MEIKITTKNYGKVIVRSAMLELSNSTDLVDGLEIKGDDIGLVEVYGWFDLDDLAEDIDRVENLIENNI